MQNNYKVYRIYDTLNSEYWSWHSGDPWDSVGVAKRNWSMYQRGGTDFDHPEQTRYIIHSFSLLRDLEEVL